MPATARARKPILISGSKRARTVDEYAPGLTERIAHFLMIKKHLTSLKVRAAYESATAAAKFAGTSRSRGLNEIIETLRKDDADKTRRILADAGLNDWGELAGEMQPLLISIYKEGTLAAIDALGLDEPASFFDKLNAEALAYAEKRGAELVGMKWINGSLVENPSAQWAITDTTRGGLRDLIERAFQDGLSPTQLGDEIEDSFLFSSGRADLISRTELSFAHTQGTNDAMKASGVVTGKRLIPSSGHVEDDCDEFFDQTYDLDDDEADPPIHPACECSLEYVLVEE